MTEELKTIAGSGGGGGCFRAGTQVQLEGGKTVAIEKLNEGDEVLAFDEHGAIHLAKVTKVHYHADPQPILKVKFWRGEVFITPNHWVLNQYGNFVEMGNLTKHDALMDGMGHLRPIIDAELVGYEPVWNLTVEPHHTFIADGIRVHNGGHRERFPVIAGSGGGGGGKGGGGRAAVEDPDSLQSRAMVAIIDLLGEGAIGGLVDGAKAIYFNDTPIENNDGSANFSGVTWDTRNGEQLQDPMAGYSDIETPTVINVKVTTNMPATATITNPNADRVRTLVTCPSLISQDITTGDTHGSSVTFRFDVSVNNKAFQPLSEELTISGKSRSRYQRAYEFDLPKFEADGYSPANTWTIKMVRITANTTSGAVGNDIIFDTLVEIVDSKLTYPNSAIVGIKIDSAQFNTVPRRAYLVDGLYIKVPANYDPVTRTYSGIWNGAFKVALSNNPAWILYDVLTSRRYGLGQFINTSQIDKSKLYQIGKYCDELVPDGFGSWEPRFTINTAIQSRVEAYRFITDLCSVFNGMAYWANGMVGFTQDSPADPGMVYTPANVVDGLFQYAGSSRKDRHSVVLVSWNDPEQSYKQIVEYVEDADLVAKFGVRKLETVAFGCTSRGQANRVGRWILYTEQYQSDMIQFKVGMDSALVLPGEIIKIHDTTRAGKRFGGRLKGCTLTSAELDAPISISAGLARISIRMPDGTFVERAVKESFTPWPITSITWHDPLPAEPLPNAIWIASDQTLEPLMARVIGISQSDTQGEFIISALEHNPSKYDVIEKGLKLTAPKASIIDVRTVGIPTNVVINEVPYQVAPGVQGLSLDVSWDAVAGGSSYEVSWKRSGKYETNWQTISTQNPLIELTNVRAGDYQFQIVAINAFGTRSPRKDVTYTTLGKTAAPGDVVNFQITRRTTDLLLTWDAVMDISLLGYEVRVGASWDSGSILTTNFAGTMLTHDQDYAGDYYYHIRSINMEGAYSDNVSTVKLTLAAPSTPKNFDVVQSGSRLEFGWLPNPEVGVVYYEIREGNSWNTGTLVSQVKATTFTIPSGGIGVRKFWLKAVASPGIYSEVPAWIDTTIAMPTNSNIVATTDEKMLGWPGNKLNMHVVGYDLMMNPAVNRAEYIFPVDLLDSYRAQNSIYATLDSIVNDTDSMNWLTSTFEWDDAEGSRHWAPGGDIDSVTGKYQIARKMGLNYGEVDGWRLHSSTTSVNGKAANTALNVAYETGRYGNGIRLRGGVKVDWTTVAVPSQFRYSAWVIPKLTGNSAEVSILEFYNTTTNNFLRIGYDEPSQSFKMVDKQGNVVSALCPINAGDVVGLVVVQTDTKRKLFVSVVGGNPASGEDDFAPSGTFDALRLYWS